MSGGAFSTAHWTTSARSSLRRAAIYKRSRNQIDQLFVASNISRPRRNNRQHKMASESQRIMNVSLTKIVSSRSRRGGVSLHRNLLVASVLFKARDVYAAEMAGLVVIRNGCVYDRSAVDMDCAEMTTPETQDLSNETTSSADDDTTVVAPSAAEESAFPTDDNLICDEQIMDTLGAVVCPPSISDSQQEQQSMKLSDLGDVETSPPENKLDCELLESCKENIEPVDSNQVTADSKVVKRKRSRKQQSTQCAKRKYTEVEQAVLSITEKDEGIVSKKMLRVENVDCEEKTNLTCSELSSSLPEWGSDRVCADREENQVSTATSQDYNKSRLESSSEDAYSSSSCARDEDQSSAYDDIGSYQSSFRSFGSDYCTTSSSADALTFSLSHPMLVMSV